MPNALTSLLPAGIGNALRQYLGDAFGGSLNAEVPNYPQMIANQAQTQQNTLRDAWGDPNKMADATLGMMNGAMGSFLPFGITAWHGSPHKFDKFDLSKIGTGEGAQAYGHGLYLAENPGVAKSYSALAHYRTSSDKEGIALAKQKLQEAQSKYDELFKSFSPEKINSMSFDDISKLKETQDVFNAQDAYKKALTSEPQLYKTDIPDEAVARFLDWDKPVPEDLRQMISKKAMEQFGSGSTGTSGEHLYKEIARELGTPAVKNSSPDASAWLAANGIPGIRYLDGGSRGAGTGTSNFVVFDPEMIRILERNGQPTGLQPWAPGEWQGLLSGAK